MRTSALRWSLLGVALLAVSAVVGYSVATVLDDDGSSPTARTETDGSTSTPDGAAASAGPQPPGGQTVVVSALGLVGWWDGTAWVANDGPAPPVEAGFEFTFLPLEGPPATATGAALTRTCEITTGQPFVELTPPFSDANAIAVSGVPRPLPRRIEPLDPASTTYRTAATEALAEIGIVDADPNLSQLMRIDLDGDGSDEILLTAERIDRSDGLEVEEGEYTAVILRRLVDGGVRSQVVAHDVVTRQEAGETPYLLDHRVAAVADLNGDGTLEVVLGADYYEGASYAVHATDGRDLREVLAVGCGV